MPNLRSYYESLLSNPNVRKALNAISKAEGADYYTLVGEGTNNTALKRYGTSRHPKDLGYKGVYNPRVNDYSTAAGRYQIVGKTWRGLQRLGIVGNSFEPREQDIAAIALIDQRGALNDVIGGNVAGFKAKVAQEWESFPMRTLNQIISYWNGGFGIGGDVTTSLEPVGQYSNRIYGKLFELNDEQRKIAQGSIPSEWRGLIVLVIAGIVLYIVLANSGYL